MPHDRTGTPATAEAACQELVPAEVHTLHEQAQRAAQKPPPSPSSFLRGLQPLLQSCAAAEQSHSGASSATASRATASCGASQSPAAEELREISSQAASPPLDEYKSAATNTAEPLREAALEPIPDRPGEGQNAASNLASAEQRQHATQIAGGKDDHSQSLPATLGKVSKQAAAKQVPKKRGKKLQCPQADLRLTGALNQEGLAATKPAKPTQLLSENPVRETKGQRTRRAKAPCNDPAAEKYNAPGNRESRKMHCTRSAAFACSAQKSLPAPGREAAKAVQEQASPGAAGKIPTRRTRSSYMNLEAEELAVKKQNELHGPQPQLPAAEFLSQKPDGSPQPSKEGKLCMSRSQEETILAGQLAARGQEEALIEPAATPLCSPFEGASLIAFPSQTLAENVPPAWISASAQFPSEVDSGEESSSGGSDEENLHPECTGSDTGKPKEGTANLVQDSPNSSREMTGEDNDGKHPINASRKGRKAGK